MSTEKVITLTKLLELTREELLEMARKQREDQQDANRIVYLRAGMPNPPLEGICNADAEYINKKFLK